MRAIEALASFISGASFDDLPDEVVASARYRVLDVIGSALWGVHVGTAGAMRRVMEPQGGALEATVLGRNLKLPAGVAAYLNSAASPALLDTCRFSTTHPGIVTVPAALACAERCGASGQDLLLGVAIGYEVLIRLGTHARVADAGFVPTALLGPLASAAASARVMNLNRRQTAHALGIAAGMGAGLLEAYSAIDSARNQFGRACQGGLLAAQLAQEGVSGNLAILEGGSMEGTPGFFRAFGQQVDLGALTRDIGSDWGILRVAPKIHDGCRYTNAAADAALQLMRTAGLTAEQVRRIRIGTFALALKVSVRHPSTVSGALFCMEFVVATALLCGDVFNDRFTLERLRDPQVEALMERVSVDLDPELEQAYPQRLGLRMEVETTDGRLLIQTVDFPRGEPENPLSKRESEDKFLHLATPLLGTDQAYLVLDAVRALDRASGVDGLLQLCTPPCIPRIQK